MRICMLSVHTCPLAALGGKKTGGMNVYVRDLAREFARRGHFVEVFTRVQDACAPRLSHELGPNCRVIHIPAGPESPMETDQVYNYLDEFVTGVLAYARANDRSYDIIHSHYWLSGVVAERLRAAWGTPIVQMFHTLGHMKNDVYEYTGERVSDLRIEAETGLMAVADAITAASPMEKAQMVVRYGATPAKISVVPLGVDRDLFHPIPKDQAKAYIDVPADKHIVLYVGRIEPLKGVDTLLRAMHRVFDAWPDAADCVNLAVIGGDANVPREQMSAEMVRLHDLSVDLGLNNLTAFLGRRRQEMLPYYYSAADVVVIPSYYESFGLVALEAMSCGTPVIASRVGGLSFTVVEGVTGFQVPGGDDALMADRIQRILRQDDLRQRLGYQAEQMSSCYGWADIAERLEGIFARLAPGGAAMAFHAPVPAVPEGVFS